MISFHRNIRDIGKADHYQSGFKFADVRDVMRVARCMSNFPWSPIKWNGGIRKQRYFLGADFCVLDFDDGELTLRQAERIFVDAIHVIGTTKSHQVAKDGKPPVDRFRVLLAFDRQIDELATYRHTMQVYIDKFGADPACKDGARFFWPCKEIVSVQDDGYSQEVFAAPEPLPHRSYELYRKERFIPRWIEGILRFGCPDNTRNSTCFKLGIYLTRCGFSELEIVEMIMRSPVPLGPEVRGEVEEAVENGASRGRREVELEEEDDEEEQDPSGNNRGESLRDSGGTSGSRIQESGRPLPPSPEGGEVQ